MTAQLCVRRNERPRQQHDQKGETSSRHFT
jgi:hypothetical protein